MAIMSKRGLGGRERAAYVNFSISVLPGEIEELARAVGTLAEPGPRREIVYTLRGRVRIVPQHEAPDRVSLAFSLRIAAAVKARGRCAD